MKQQGKILFEFAKQLYEAPEMYMAEPEFGILTISGYIDEEEEFEEEGGDWGREEGGDDDNKNGLFGSGSPWWMP